MDRNHIQNVFNDTYLDVVKTSCSHFCHILMNFVILVGPKLNFVDKVKMHKEVCRIIFDEYLTNKKSHDEETGSSKGKM